MSPDTQFDFGPVPPLVIGVSGRMEFADDATRQRVKDAVTTFLWRFVEPDPTSSHVHPDWPAMPHTPIAVLSSLAPGADWLLAEVVDELEKRYQGLLAERKKRPWGFKVFAPLPFPAEQYATASTYTGERGKADQEKAKAQMLELAKTGHAFLVPLKEDAEACDTLPQMTDPNCTQAELNDLRRQCLLARTKADLGSRERRHLRYRAAGEYIAAHSHLMLILNDKVTLPTATPDEVTLPLAAELHRGQFDAGSEQVLLSKRQGITPNLLRGEVAFTWADSGPVIHFHTPAVAAPDAGGITVLYPVDTRTYEGDVPNADDAWRWEAGVRFGEVLAQLEAFNARMVTRAGQSPETVGGELKKLVPLPDGCLDGSRGPVQAEYARGLDRLARARRRAGDLAGAATTKWKQHIFWLFILTLFAALLLHLGLHWHTHAAHPDQTHATADDKHPADEKPPADKNAAAGVETGIRFGTVLVAAGLIGWAYISFRRFKNSSTEAERFDDRAMSEGLKVQTYWAAAGLSQSVPANYMQRQRNEMVWIRRAITALAAPYTRWADGFASLTEREQLSVLGAIISGWVRWDQTRAPAADADAAERARRSAQAGWMERAAYEDHRAEEFWKRFGLDLTRIGVTHIVVWLVSLLWTVPFGGHGCPVWLCVTGGVLFGGFMLLWVTGFLLARARQTPAGHDHGFPTASRWRRQAGFWAAWWGGFVWARAVVYFHSWVWDMAHLERKVPKANRQTVSEVMRYLNVGLVALACCAISFPLCHLLGDFSRWIPDAGVWWTFVFGALLVSGALAYTWPERHLMAEHARQYESMWAMYQAAGRRLLGHLSAAEAALAAKDLHLFRERVKAIQEMLYQVGLQALDENAEWLILHRSRPLEPLMAG